MVLLRLELVGFACDRCDAVMLHPFVDRPAAFASRMEARVELAESNDEGWQGWQVSDDGSDDLCPGCARAIRSG